jgi:hypothetical protein
VHRPKPAHPQQLTRVERLSLVTHFCAAAAGPSGRYT